MSGIKVEFLSPKAAYDGTLMKILMTMQSNGIDCEILDKSKSLLRGEHDIMVAYQDTVPVGIIAYNKPKNRIDRFCAKTPDVYQKLRVTLAKRIPKVDRLLLGSPTFKSPPGFTSPYYEDYERQVRGEFKLPSAANEKEEYPDRSTDFKADNGKEYKSSFGVKGNIGGRLKTRRRKHRNGSTQVRRHRSRRVSSRKNKTRNA